MEIIDNRPICCICGYPMTLEQNMYGQRRSVCSECGEIEYIDENYNEESENNNERGFK